MDRIEEMIQNLELLRMHFGDITKTCMANGIIDSIIKSIEKFRTYENAERQGLLLRLPCKVGDMVYCIEDKQVWCCMIEKISISKNNGTWIEISFPEEMPGLASMEFYPNAIGKTVFLTREEAEAKLKEMEEKDGR